MTKPSIVCKENSCTTPVQDFLVSQLYPPFSFRSSGWVVGHVIEPFKVGNRGPLPNGSPQKGQESFCVWGRVKFKER